MAGLRIPLASRRPCQVSLSEREQVSAEELRLADGHEYFDTLMQVSITDTLNIQVCHVNTLATGVV
jgi:hypothetical protein